MACLSSVQHAIWFVARLHIAHIDLFFRLRLRLYGRRIAPAMTRTSMACLSSVQHAIWFVARKNKITHRPGFEPGPKGWHSNVLPIALWMRAAYVACRVDYKKLVLCAKTSTVLRMSARERSQCYAHPHNNAILLNFAYSIVKNYGEQSCQILI